MPLQSEPRKKTYSAPRLSKLTPDQANLTLIGHASCGDQGAKDLLDVLYPLPEAERNQNVCSHSEDESPARTNPRMSRLIRRALTTFQSSREDFHRFIRG